jgi:hypothetical protein
MSSDEMTRGAWIPDDVQVDSGRGPSFCVEGEKADQL